MEKIYDVVIVGGGIVGAATFYKMASRFPDLKLALIEKEDHLAAHQTGNNSGVIHSGLYYKPGSQKATHCVQGRRELVKFAQEYNVTHDVCGKVVVAAEDREIQYLDKIFNIGLENEIEGIEKITRDQVKEIEPFCEGIAGIRVPCTGIIDFKQATRTMVEVGLSKCKQADVFMGEKVEAVVKQDGISILKTNKQQVKAKHVIFCAGLWADKMAKKDGVKLKEKVVGFRGDYYELTDQGKHKVKHLIYPVPDPAFPFLGVHFTRMTDGEIECGPNAVFTFKREGYGKTDFSLKDTVDALSYGGTWKLFFNNMSFGINEYRRAFSKKRFLETLQRLIPSLTMEDIRPGRSGVRALLLSEDGDTRDDFRIAHADNNIHVLNAPSPAATASLAIGNSVVNMAEKHFGLETLV
ncbi:L-2-hydroxyglutarate oxidase [Luteibaculum oceani]|uniref:L-2-hydroxyglutarate oxidase n=1 Tax=Luteibaculum oceani TaxID=1294296 RepID=A0A5C6VA92_9FLAO|nr:L-2-hydroxyglutarate oxidase [Luteibaculum oceani]TXC81704.1 L-2-hydroxyglutarate oxidase [Luteibaculum oceani]